MGGKIGNLGNSLPGYSGIWREILASVKKFWQVEGNFCIRKEILAAGSKVGKFVTNVLLKKFGKCHVCWKIAFFYAWQSMPVWPKKWECIMFTLQRIKFWKWWHSLGQAPSIDFAELPHGAEGYLPSWKFLCFRRRLCKILHSFVPFLNQIFVFPFPNQID